jgi:hypothetical protein
LFRGVFRPHYDAFNASTGKLGINVSFGINALISFGMVDWIFTPQPQIRAGLANGGLRILQRGLGCGLNLKRVRVEP